MEEIKKQLSELANQIQNQETINTLVSKSSIGWHIEHTLLVMNITIESIKESNPVNYKKTFNFKRIIVFVLNKIPRGKIRAPKAVQPKEDFTIDSLKEHIEKSKLNLEKLNALNSSYYFDHPFLGHLKLNSTIKFIKLHTQHHINIINEIIKS